MQGEAAKDDKSAADRDAGAECPRGAAVKVCAALGALPSKSKEGGRGGAREEFDMREKGGHSLDRNLTQTLGWCMFDISGMCSGCQAEEGGDWEFICY